MKKLGFFVILACVGFMSLGAATVSVVVVEAGLPSEKGCTPSAAIWESGMMDVFYDAGHIVFNSPCFQITGVSGSLPEEVNNDFNEARTGGADFFVLVILNHSNDKPENYKEVIIRVFRVSTGALLHETSVNGRIWGSRDDEFLAAKQNAGRLIPRFSLKD